MMEISNGKLIGTFVLDKPPSWNAVYKTSRNGHIYMTKDGKEWKTLACARLRTEKHCQKLDTIEHKVFIRYEIYLANAERSDIDNRLKLTNDVLEESGVIANDYLIYGALIHKHKCPRNAQRIELSVYEYFS